MEGVLISNLSRVYGILWVYRLFMCDGNFFKDGLTKFIKSHVKNRH